MNTEKKISLLKKAALTITSLVLSLTTAVTGLSIATTVKSINKNNKGKARASKEAVLNMGVPSQKKLDEMVVEDSKNVGATKISNSVSSENVKTTSESAQNSIDYTYSEIENLEVPTADCDYSYSEEYSNEEYSTRNDIALENESGIDDVYESGSLIEANEINYDCPKDETEEEREARIKANQAERDRIIQEEKERYAEYLAGFYDPLLKEYAKYYHLNGNKVVDIAKKMTNKYTIDMNNFIKGVYYDKNNMEAMIMMFVERLSKNQLTVSIAKYGYTMSSIMTSNKIDRLNANLILSNGQSFTSFFGNVCDMMGVDKYSALGICFWETGRLTYGRYTNNFGGMMTSDVPVTPEAGIIELIKLIKSYEAYGLKLTSNKEDIRKFGGRYCPGDSSWVDGVYSIRWEVYREKDRYFPEKKDYTKDEGESYMMRSDEPTYGMPHEGGKSRGGGRSRKK